MWAAQTWVWAGEWAAGSKRQPWFTGQACSFTREISRATINTTVSFKGAVYHTTGFEGPQTDLVFFCCTSPSPSLKCTVSLKTIKWEFTPFTFRVTVNWLARLQNKPSLCNTRQIHISLEYLKVWGWFNHIPLCWISEQRAQTCQEPFQVNCEDFQWAPPASKTFIQLKLMYYDLKWGLMICLRKRLHKTYSPVKVTQPCSMCSINHPVSLLSRWLVTRFILDELLFIQFYFILWWEKEKVGESRVVIWTPERHRCAVRGHKSSDCKSHVQISSASAS